MIDVDVNETALALELVIVKSGVGGVTGLSPTVAIRKLPSTTLWLDWDDGTFKTSGWGTRDAPMTDVERGIYQKTLDVAALALPLGTKLSAEYNSSDAGYLGEDVDVLHVTTLHADATLLRKGLVNRLEETSGSPGTLTLYDDDGATVLKTWSLRDEGGNAVNPAIGTPARRGAAT